MLALALIEAGELSRAQSLLAEVIEAAQRAGDERVEWRARVGQTLVDQWLSGPGEEARAAAEEAFPVFERIGDDLGLARTWQLLTLIEFWSGNSRAAEQASARAVEFARMSHSIRDEAEALTWLLIATWFGPTSVQEGVRRCKQILQETASRRVEAMALVELGPLLAQTGSFAEARESWTKGVAMLEELGLRIQAAGMSEERFDIEVLAGDLQAAEAELRDACEVLQQLGERGFLSTRAACLAVCLCMQRRFDEAEPFLQLALESGAPDDWGTLIYARMAQAAVLADRGRADEAERYAREAVATAARTDWLNVHGDALVQLAELLHAAERAADALPLLRDALGLYEEKGNLVAAQRTRARLAELQTATAS